MSLHTLIREILDEEINEIDDASDIHKDWHNELVKAWRAEVTVADCYDAFMNPVNAKAETLLEQMSADMPNALITGSTELQRLMSEYWYIQIGWAIDTAIHEVKADSARYQAIAREERAEQQAEWQRERYADAKEFAA